MFETSEPLWRVLGLVLNAISHLLPSYWGSSFALGCGASPQNCSSTTGNSHDSVKFIQGMYAWFDMQKLITIIQNRIKQMIITIHVSKAFDKMQHPFT